jgi:hypothetical protein
VIVYRAEIPETGETWEVEYQAISDALHFACRDLREGRRRPIEILEDGVRVHDADSIARECREIAEEMEREHGLPLSPGARPSE